MRLAMNCLKVFYWILSDLLRKSQNYSHEQSLCHCVSQMRINLISTSGMKQIVYEIEKKSQNEDFIHVLKDKNSYLHSFCTVPKIRFMYSQK